MTRRLSYPMASEVFSGQGRTRVPSIGRQILIHWTIREVCEVSLYLLWLKEEVLFWELPHLSFFTFPRLGGPSTVKQAVWKECLSNSLKQKGNSPPYGSMFKSDVLFSFPIVTFHILSRSFSCSQWDRKGRKCLIHCNQNQSQHLSF